MNKDRPPVSESPGPEDPSALPPDELRFRKFMSRLYSSFDIEEILSLTGNYLRRAFSLKTFEGSVFSHQSTVQVRSGYSETELGLLKAHQRTLRRSADLARRHELGSGAGYILVQDARTDPAAVNKDLVRALRETSYLTLPLLAPKKTHKVLRGNLPIDSELGTPTRDGRWYVHGYLHVARRARQQPLTRQEAEQIAEIAREVSQAVLFAKFRDLAELLTNTDALTGTWHFGRYFLPRLEEAFLSDSVVSVILTDVDNFKPYNDTFGHPFGSRLIVEFGRFIQRNLRNKDDALLSRMGGDEFAILLREPVAVAERVAERLRRRFAKHRFPGERERGLKGLTISLGVADSSQARSPEAVIEMADEALYRAKAEGRNRVCVPPAQQPA